MVFFNSYLVSGNSNLWMQYLLQQRLVAHVSIPLLLIWLYSSPYISPLYSYGGYRYLGGDGAPTLWERKFDPTLNTLYYVSCTKTLFNPMNLMVFVCYLFVCLKKIFKFYLCLFICGNYTLSLQIFIVVNDEICCFYNSLITEILLVPNIINFVIFVV